MTQKSKPQQTSITDKISNDFLFLKRFHFRTSLPENIVLDNLYQLNEVQVGEHVKTSKFEVTLEQHSDHSAFKILAGSLKEGKFGIVYGTGRVIPYADGTVVEGSVRFGALIFVLVVFAFVWNVFWLQFPMPQMWYVFMAGWSLLALVGGFIGMTRERNLLLKELAKSLTPGNYSSQAQSEARLSDASNPADFGFADDENMGQSGYEQR